MTVPGAGALSRRQFLERGGAVVVSFAMPPAFLGSRPDGAWAAPGPAGVPDPARLDSWLALAEDGSVTVFTGALELGMGVSTAYAQIVAEELDVPFRSVSVVMGDTARTPDQGGIGGSRAIEFGARPLRNAPRKRGGCCWSWHRPASARRRRGSPSTTASSSGRTTRARPRRTAT